MATPARSRGRTCAACGVDLRLDFPRDAPQARTKRGRPEEAWWLSPSRARSSLAAVLGDVDTKRACLALVTAEEQAHTSGLAAVAGRVPRLLLEAKLKIGEARDLMWQAREHAGWGDWSDEGSSLWAELADAFEQIDALRSEATTCSVPRLAEGARSCGSPPSPTEKGRRMRALRSALPLVKWTGTLAAKAEVASGVLESERLCHACAKEASARRVNTWTVFLADERA
jgi:hypothetical protein